MSKPAEKPNDEMQTMIDWWTKEQPARCPLCGSTKVDVIEREDVDISTGYFAINDYFECKECGGKGEYD